MKKIKKHFKRLAVAAGTVVGSAGVACAESASGSIVDVTGLTPDTSAVGTLGIAIVTGLLGIWGYRKIVKSVNRS